METMPRPSMPSPALQAALRELYDHVARTQREQTRQLQRTVERLREEVWRRERAEAELRRLAYQDPLTGGPNWTQALEQGRRLVAQARAEGTALAVVCADLDLFRNINDALGHAVGDAVLQTVAHMGQQRIAPPGVWARMSGDRFVAVLPDCDAACATQWAQRLVQRAQEPIVVLGHEVVVPLSAGVAWLGEHGHDFEALVAAADMALNEAKAAGRRSWRVYNPALQSRSERVHALHRALSQAVQRGELSLHYQPQVRLTDGAPLGVEALLRWHHPRLGVVPPAEFIGVAEDSGLIIPLGDWVLEQALRQWVQWHDQGVPCARVAVNVSVAQFRQGDFPHRVQAALRRTGAPAHALELELTESVLAHDAEAALATTEALRALGVPLAIDDFGTGYSSLAYLRRFAVQRLKIDRSFVADVGRDGDAEAIVDLIAALAQRLGLQTVAEGVENPTQGALLLARGCQLAQGYAYARPMPPDECASWLRTAGR
ncbi:MAG: bifunctional diguanylate cyclase/phosphodiesterase [Tepidimonas ignava]|uniref:Diguanylate cyclase (GGDEF)-like protein n=1 Tax=Tepidimonas ignava TaxID=114249 RepID=A0A4R3LI39_9BURK|nr:bifunctional diguanylate cyclase/phosphodiesterase [Tepidimonas ignava]MCX7814062.1 bifunctional diguanylate cyclase/phosphodiesterase [Tepidimonas ignava]TCS98124.1 diguanylate cyclase (GGDEF)-like protein [Tepidimonas ignava]TSE22631.1 putative signaling protein [Tepidimonas ignava]